MGHYDDAYDAMYAEQRAESARRRQFALPGIIGNLEAALSELSRRVNDIAGAARIMAEIEYALLVLRGQEPRR